MSENGTSAREKIETYVVKLRNENPDDYATLQHVFFFLVNQEVITAQTLALSDNEELEMMRALYENDPDYTPVLSHIIFILDQLDQLSEMNDMAWPFLLKQFELTE